MVWSVQTQSLLQQPQNPAVSGTHCNMKDADIPMLTAAPSSRDERQSVLVLFHTRMDQENVYIHKRVLVFYREKWDCVLRTKITEVEVTKLGELSRTYQLHRFSFRF